MEEMTKEEFKALKKYEDEIGKIIRNASASSISAGLQELVIDINRRIGIKDCDHCNSSLYRMMTRVYSMYVDYQIKNKKKK